MGATRTAVVRRLVVLTIWISLATRTFAQGGQIEPYRNPFLRAAQSLVVPGWGQFSNGDSGRAAFWFFDSIVALAFASKFVSLGSGENSVQFWRTTGWVAYGLNATVSSIDAYRKARSLNRENGYDLDELDSAFFGEHDANTSVVLISLDF
jgi:hypothetical protein